jgi:hypothetical protein
VTPRASFITAGATAALLDVWWIQVIVVACTVVAFRAWLDRYTLRTERERIRVNRERWKLEQEQQAARHDGTTPYVPITRRQPRSQRRQPGRLRGRG